METIFSAVLGDLLSRSISFVIDRYCRQQQDVEEDIQRLHRVLLRIQTIVEEANMRSITNQAMLLHIKAMRDMMYRGYYFLDNFRYRIAPGHAQHEVGDHSLSLFPFNPLKRFRFSTMARKMVSEDQEKNDLRKMLGCLESIISEEFVMSLRSYPRMIRQPYCSYLLLENCMFGRQAEQERVISFLLEPRTTPGTEGISVLPIIGPARIGKGTLVEHVCHDERVRKYFSTIVFYCTDSIEGAAADTVVIKHRNPVSTEQSLAVIEHAGDMDDETWRRILNRLRGENSTPVSRIIITSQSKKTSTFGTTEALQLDFLPREAYWYFFKTIAFGSTNPEEEPKLASICMDIAAVQNGSLLAINIVGGILRSNLNVKFWYNFLKRMKAITDWHFSLLGEHPTDAYKTKSGHTYIWFPKLNRFVEARYNLYEESSARLNDPPMILASNILTGNVELQEKFDVLQWRSSIPPYYSYMTRYEMIEQSPNMLPTRKRSRVVSEG